jgi:hypothetical protein
MAEYWTVICKGCLEPSGRCPFLIVRWEKTGPLVSSRAPEGEIQMDLMAMLAELRLESGQITEAISSLERLEGVRGKRLGRPPGSKNEQVTHASQTTSGKPKSQLSCTPDGET